MASRIGLDVVRNRASYERFLSHEQYMFENFKSCWVNQAQIRSLSCPSPILGIRGEVLTQLKNVSINFPGIVFEQEHSYSVKKETIPFKSPIEKRLNDKAMDRCQEIFTRQFRGALLKSAESISLLLPKVEEHFNQFQKLLGQARDPQVAEIFVEQAHAIRREINQILIEVAGQSDQSAQKVANLTARRMAIGPAFTTNPAIFFMGVPLLLKKETGLTGKPIEAVVDEIEGIKQEKSVNQAVEPLHLLLLNALQSMRKLEKGMAKYWAQECQIPSKFGVDFRPRTQLKSNPAL